MEDDEFGRIADVAFEKYDSALVNYFGLSDALADDVTDLLKLENTTLAWRRNFIRVSVALVEGYCHCFREMTLSVLPVKDAGLSSKEKKALNAESSCNTVQRIKYSITAFHKTFDLNPMPKFSDQGWINSRSVIVKRHTLMHPQIASDMVISEQEWIGLRAGVMWTFGALFTAMNTLRDNALTASEK